jgi:hypothetical protein
MRTCLAVMLSALAVVSAAPTASAATGPVDLGTLPGGTFSGTVAVNERGTIADHVVASLVRRAAISSARLAASSFWRSRATCCSTVLGEM